MMHQDSDWLMNSGVTHHVIPRRDVFVIHRSENFDAVKVKNKNISQIVGIGDVYLETETG